MTKDVIIENEFTKSHESALQKNRCYRRWTPEEDKVLLEVLTNDNIRTVEEFKEIASYLIGRTTGAVYTRAAVRYDEFFSMKFRKNEDQQIKMVGDESLLVMPMTPDKDQLDSRMIFELYEKLSEFYQKVNVLQEENQDLRKYYDLSEKELQRLRNELQAATDDHNRAVTHIKNIQSLILNLSQSAFGKEANASVQTTLVAITQQESEQKVVV